MPPEQCRPGSDGRASIVDATIPDDLVSMLEGRPPTRDSAKTWERVLSRSEPWGRLRCADHRSGEADAATPSWVPDVEPVDAEDAWHPEYAPISESC
jgi:hypothetical protein